VPQAHLQVARLEMRMPGPHRLAVVIEHAHQVDAQGGHVAGAGVDFGPWPPASGGRQLYVLKSGVSPGRGRHAEADAGAISWYPDNFTTPHPKMLHSLGMSRIIRYIHSEF